MDERKWDVSQPETEETTPPPSTSNTTKWVIAVVVALIVGVGFAVAHGYRQRTASIQPVSNDAEMSATINQMQSQIDGLTAKLNEVTSAPPATAAPVAQPPVDPTAVKRRTAAENKRYKQLQSQLADEQQQLKDTQDRLAQQGADLEGSVNSTRDELNGSIARTHDELVTLEQKGERSYFEFDIVKAKHFQRTGPLMISLRKADAKHKNYDLAMFVDDNQLSKKHVNLYEPIWIDGTDSQQVQLVVNKIDKDHIHGYVSAPKYNQSASLTPVSSRTNSDTTEPTVDQSTSTSPSDSSTAPTTQQQPQQ